MIAAGVLRDGRPNYGLTLRELRLARIRANELLSTLTAEQIEAYLAQRVSFAELFPNEPPSAVRRGVRFLFADVAQGQP